MPRLRLARAPCGRRRSARQSSLTAGCRTGRAIDIRTIDRHPLASVGSLVLGLRCTWCGGAGPMPKIMGLHQLPPAAAVRA